MTQSTERFTTWNFYPDDHLVNYRLLL